MAPMRALDSATLSQGHGSAKEWSRVLEITASFDVLG